MGADLLECSDERLYVGVGEVARNVLIYPLPVATDWQVERAASARGHPFLTGGRQVSY